MIIVWISCKYLAKALALKRYLTNDINHCYSDLWLPKPLWNHDVSTLFSAHSNQRLNPIWNPGKGLNFFISSKPQLPLLSWSSVASQKLKTLLLKISHPLEGELEDGTELGLLHWGLAHTVAEGETQAAKGEKSSLWLPQNLMIRITRYHLRCESTTYILW